MRVNNLKDREIRIGLIGTGIMALIALFLGIVVLFTLDLSHETMVLGPGFYPLLVCIIMFLASLYASFNLLFGKSEGLGVNATIDNLKKPLALFALIAVAVATIPLFGFIGSMFLFSILELTFFEQDNKSMLWRILTSALLSGGVFYLFRALGVYLPMPFWL